ncbi:hypothetical protein EG68_02715 [Paragonimus skrjabini miyazakii]|uniref:G-protein coupled receptors family 1 profile domain-containing protein n=1 Tax=Paragonimus skrjabini miyazakii TaxID=59628 RepID=A0A8S9Z5T5_9TREM|nr:hypothetical protein EG68_02715 [Paragonimus skrjabini miyazakii]
MNFSFSLAPNVESHPSQFEQISCTTASVLVMLFIVVGNSLVVLSIFTYQPLQQVQNVLIVSLATSDLAVGLFVLPLKIGTHVADGRWIFGFYLCTFYVTSDVFFCTASILNLCAVALDRYWTIRYPINYARQRTLFSLSGMISLVYLLSTLIVLPPIFGWAPPIYEHIDAVYSCEMNRQPSYVIFSAFGSFFIPAILILFVYVQLFRLTRRRFRVQRHQNALTSVARSPGLTVRFLNEPKVNLLDHRDGLRYDLSRSARYSDAFQLQHPHVFSQDNLIGTTSLSNETLIRPNTMVNGSFENALRLFNRLSRERSTEESIKQQTEGGGAKFIGWKASLQCIPEKACSQDRPLARWASCITVSAAQSQLYHSCLQKEYLCTNTQKKSASSLLYQENCQLSLSINQPVCNPVQVIDGSNKKEWPTTVPHLPGILNERRRMNLKNAFSSTSSTLLKCRFWKELVEQSTNSPTVTDGIDLHTVAKERRQFSAYRERRVTRTLIIIIGSFFLCWLPFFLAYVSDPFCHGPCIKNEKAHDLITWLTYLNSVVNPVIYTTFNADFRRGFQRLLCCSK